jgi:hypothetical protein
MRFTLRDLIWVMVVVGITLGWCIERRKTLAVMNERDAATAQWHEASKKWVEATTLPREAWGRNNTWMQRGSASTTPLTMPAPSEDSN